MASMRSFVMSLRMDASGAVRDLGTYTTATARADAMTKRFGGSVGLVQAHLGLVAGAVGMMGVASFKAFSEFDRAAGLANIRAGQMGRSTASLSAELKPLSRSLNMSRLETVELVGIINQFGKEARPISQDIARMSHELALLGDTTAKDVAPILFRLGKITGDTTATGLLSTAAAINAVGKQTTAGVGELIKFLQQFQTIGVVAENMSAPEIVAFAGAIADMTPQLKELSTTAFSRALTSENFGVMANALGETTEGLKVMRKERPVEFLQKLLLTMRQMQDEDKLLSFTKAAGLGEQRSIRGMAAAILGLDNLDPNAEDSLINLIGQENLQKLREEFGAESQALLNDSQGSIDRLASSFNDLKIAAGGMAANVFQPLIDSLTKLFRLLEDNKALLFVLVGGLGALGVASAGALGATLFKGVGGLLGGGKGKGIKGAGMGIMNILGLGGPGRTRAAINTHMLGGRGAAMGAGLKGLGGRAVGGLASMFPGTAMMGRAAMGGIGKFASSAMTRIGLTSGGGMAMGMVKLLPVLGSSLAALAGPIGWIITLVDPLTAIFSSMGEKLMKLGGEKGGALGAFLKWIGVFSKAIGFVGKVIQMIFRIVGQFFTKLVEGAKKLLPDKWVKGMSDFADSVGDVIDDWGESVDGVAVSSDKANDSMQGLKETLNDTGDTASRVTNQFSVFIGGRNFATEAFTEILQSATGVGGASAAGGF